MQGSHVTRGEESSYRGDPLHAGRSFQPVPFGNEVALNVGKGGPCTGRTIYKTGSQGTQGSVASGNPRPQGRDTLSEFGSDYRRPHNLAGRPTLTLIFKQSKGERKWSRSSIELIKADPSSASSIA
jgi:hypothetical protein